MGQALAQLVNRKKDNTALIPWHWNKEGILHRLFGNRVYVVAASGWQM